MTKYITSLTVCVFFFVETVFGGYFFCRFHDEFRFFCFISLQVKRDMVAIKHELDTVQQVKEEIEELREYVDRLEEHTHRRKLRLLEQVSQIK